MQIRAAISISIVVAGPAVALVGGAQPEPELARSAVMIVGSRGNFCTGAVIARDLVLTAAHCVTGGADYKLVEFDAQRQPALRDIARIERHPQFNLDNYLKARVTADVALLKLAAPLSDALALATSGAKLAVAPGDRFRIAGYGLARPGDGRSGGTLRGAALVATGRPGNLQIRLMDASARNERSGLGACTGDSGAPVFRDGERAVIGVVSWSTGPGNSEGCGGLTGVTPLQLYHPWIAETARRLGSPLQP